jgi:hypothetical protein
VASREGESIVLFYNINANNIMPKQSNRRRVNDVVCFSCDDSIEKCLFNFRSTVKPSQEVTSIKQPSVLKGKDNFSLCYGIKDTEVNILKSYIFTHSNYNSIL